jgi:hypothetical protein
MDAITYTSDYVAQVAGVPYRTLMRWVQQDLIRPQYYARKNRVPVEWSAKNVREAVILARMRTCRLSMQKIREVLKYLRGIGHNPLSTGDFLVLMDRDGRPEEVIKVCTTGEALKLMGKGRGQLVLPLWNPEMDGNV